MRAAPSANDRVFLVLPEVERILVRWGEHGETRGFRDLAGVGVSHRAVGTVGLVYLKIEALSTCGL